MKELTTKFFDNNIRTEKIFHLPTQCLDESPSDDVYEAFCDDSEQIFKELGLDDDLFDDICGDRYNFSCELNDRGLDGFLVRFATPIPRSINESGGYTFSWGMYTTKYIYAPTYEEACAKALEWQEDYIQRKIKEFN